MEIQKTMTQWLCSIPGIGIPAKNRLIEAAGGVQKVKYLEKDKYSAILTNKQAQEFKKALLKDPEEEMKKLELSGISFFCLDDKEYPAKLRALENAPLGIYVKGRLPREDLPTVAIVGARFCSAYGRYMAKQFGLELAQAGIQVVSGMALGVDGIAQREVLRQGGYSAGVLGCGVEVCYPPENRDLYDSLAKSGGLISEYPIDAKPEAHMFPPRNRIIAGLADAVLVVEARKKSGTLITVAFAQAAGKKVFALPGRATDRLSDGCNELIKTGAARAVTCGESIVNQLTNPFAGLDGNGHNVEVTMEVTLRKAFPIKMSDDEYASLVSDGTLGDFHRQIYNSIMSTPLDGDVDVDYSAYDTDHGKELVPWSA